MKNSNLWMLLLFPLLFSCSMDDNATSDSSGGATQNKNGSTTPAYDAAGIVQNEILESFLAHEDSAGTLGAALEQVVKHAAKLPRFQGLAQSGFIVPSETRIAYLLDGVPSRLEDVILHSSLSVKGKLSLMNFATSLSYYKSQQADYVAIGTFISSFEASVLSDTTYSSKDLKVLLTATSLLRNAFKFAATHKKRKPRDRDWDISVGHIAIAIDFGSVPPATAAVASAAALLHENY